MHIHVDEVGTVIAEITRGLEADRAQVSKLIASRNGFEKWWQHSVFLGLTEAPWHRTPGFDIAEGAGVAVESYFAVGDRRRTFTRTTGKEEKRVDLIIRKAPTGTTSHLVEMKVLDGARATTRVIESIHSDISALQTMRVWQEVASCWMSVLAHGFADADAVKDCLQGAYGPTVDAHTPRIVSITAPETAARIWVASIKIRG